MKPFRLLWVIHKWLGIGLGLLLLLIASTGFLLLIKRESSWLVPPTASGTPGDVAAIPPMHAVLDAVFVLGLDELGA